MLAECILLIVCLDVASYLDYFISLLYNIILLEGHILCLFSALHYLK